MSTNVHRQLVRRSRKDASDHYFNAWERVNNVDEKWPSVAVTNTNHSIAERTYNANLYTHLLFSIDYRNTRFNYADITVTNRFTMDSYSVTVNFGDCTSEGNAGGVYYGFRQIFMRTRQLYIKR